MQFMQRNTPVLAALFGVVMMLTVLIFGIHRAVGVTDRDGTVYRHSNRGGLQVGSAGTIVDFLATGFAQLPAGDEVTTITVSGAQVSDQVFVFPASCWGAAVDPQPTRMWGYGIENGVVLKVNEDADTTVTLNWMVLGYDGVSTPTLFTH